MTKDRDKELDQMLEPFRDVSPSDIYMKRWQNAVQAELQRQTKRQRFSMRRLFDIAVAASVGCAIGIWASQHRQATPESTNDFFSADAATVQHVYTNIDSDF
ncbi:MAG: hypothetical protein AB7T49_11590 [Oligoflexales bacterium]